MSETPRKLADDCLSLSSGAHLTPVDEALALLRARAAPVTGIEEISVAGAAGRILAAPLRARRDSPPHDNSAVDGYAFAHAALGGGESGAGGGSLTLSAGRAAAGAPFAGVVPPGAAVRILTGARIPVGVDTVAMQEDVRLADGGGAGGARAGARIVFGARLRRGANVRRAGEDAAEGAVAVAAGRVLRPQDLALAVSVGIDRVLMRRRLRVAVLSTGDELIQPGAAVGATEGGNGIFDANRPMLRAMTAGLGGEVLDLGAIPDDAAALASALDQASAVTDAIITSGGASGGDEDHVSRALRERGALTVWRIAVKPGRPLAMGVWNGTPVFGLPGNPVAAFVCFAIFARPVLLRLAGADWIAPRRYRAPAGFAMVKKAGRREFLRGRIGADGRVEKFRSEGSGLISGLSWSDGLIDLPEAARDIAPGDPVDFIPYAELGL